MAPEFSFDAELWLWEGKAAWHFLSLPTEVTDEIDDVVGGNTNGFGSVRVDVTIGATTWSTSVFPDTKRSTFVLPVKKPVRTAEGIGVGDVVAVILRLSPG